MSPVEAMLVQERYKVIRVLDVCEDYAFVEAVDILDREKRSYQLNIYEGPLLRSYLPYFDQMNTCGAFAGVFLAGKSLVTVFEHREGKSIDEVFFRGDRHDWRLRLEYAELLFHEALNLADLPPAVSCAAMLSENVLVDMENKRIRLRFKVAPMEDMTPRELVYLTVDQVKKILRPQVSSSAAEWDFIELLDRGQCTTVTRLYGLWREWSESIRGEREKLEKMNVIRRGLTLAWNRVKRSLSRRGRR